MLILNLTKSCFPFWEVKSQTVPPSLALVSSVTIHTPLSLWLLWEEAQASGNLITSSNGTEPMYFHVANHVFIIDYFFIFMERPQSHYEGTYVSGLCFL